MDLVHKLLYPCNWLCITVRLPWEDKALQLSGLKVNTSSELYVATAVAPVQAVPLCDSLSGRQ